jgi:hypothetical protein
MSARDRRTIRYGAAGVAVVAGVICAAALTDTVGNTLATVLVGGGLLAIVIFLLRDMGLIDASAKPEPPPPSRNGANPSDRSSPGAGTDPPHPPGQGRRSVNVRRPDRLRGQRRRLR